MALFSAVSLIVSSDGRSNPLKTKLASWNETCHLRHAFREVVPLIIYALLLAVATLGAVTLTGTIVESHRRRSS
jgi:hypothetical protein